MTTSTWKWRDRMQWCSSRSRGIRHWASWWRPTARGRACQWGRFDSGLVENQSMKQTPQPSWRWRIGHHWRIPAADGKNSFLRECPHTRSLSWHMLLNGDHAATPITEAKVSRSQSPWLVLLFWCAWSRLQTIMQGCTLLNFFISKKQGKHN